ncbi:MAG: hypothetical protein ACNS63_07530 [Candidatus Nitrospinota bacterium M3_3B_026]
MAWKKIAPSARNYFLRAKRFAFLGADGFPGCSPERPGAYGAPQAYSQSVADGNEMRLLFMTFIIAFTDGCRYKNAVRAWRMSAGLSVIAARGAVPGDGAGATGVILIFGEP